MIENPERGIKYDGEKPQMGLISSKFLVGLAKVLTFGARKYQAHNWRKGMATSRYYNALQRHLVEWNDGQDLDSESGLPHLYHAACCLMFLAETLEVRPDLDDRYKHVPKTGDDVQADAGPSFPQLPEKLGHLPHSTDGASGHSRFPFVHVRPLCGAGVEEPQRDLGALAKLLLAKDKKN